MEKIAAKKVESIKSEFTFSVNSEEKSFPFFQRQNFPYYQANGNRPYDIHKIRCPKCFKEIGVKIGTNQCAWCNSQIEVEENYSFLE